MSASSARTGRPRAAGSPARREPPNQLGRAAEPSANSSSPRIRPAREEEPERERELARLDALGDVLERNARLLEGRHQAHDVDVRGAEAVLVPRVEEAQILQAPDLVRRAGCEPVSSSAEILPTARL